MKERTELFQFEDHQIRVVKDEQGEPWFLGMDICSVLEIEKSWSAYLKLAPVEKATVSRIGLGLNPGRPLTIVSESGLYKLILRSDKTQAKPFQNWVTQEVLPRIRKTGGYIAGEERMSDDELVLKAMQVLQRKLDEKQKIIEEQAPKAEFFDKYADCKGKYTFTDAGKILGVSAVKFCAWLREYGYLFQGRNVQGSYKNLPIQRFEDSGMFVVKTRYNNYGIASRQVFITPKGFTELSKAWKGCCI